MSVTKGAQAAGRDDAVFLLHPSSPAGGTERERFSPELGGRKRGVELRCCWLSAAWARALKEAELLRATSPGGR